MNQTTITKQRGLSDFALKYFAMVCMILDHIHYFFSFTGKIPLFFSGIGRLAAPLFLFCIVEGFLHTHDRKKYFLRIYAIAIFMGLVQFSFYNIASGLVRPDGFFPQNQMLASFSVLLVVLWGIDRCQKKQWIRGLSAILIPVFLPFLLYGLFAVSAAFGIPYGNFLLSRSSGQGACTAPPPDPSLNPSEVQCPALPHCDHRRWHRHTARRRDSLPDAQTPQIAGGRLRALRACVGYPARAAFYARRNFCLFLFYRCL